MPKKKIRKLTEKEYAEYIAGLKDGGSNAGQR